ncbi:MAG: ABC transporter permease subunit [Candidatus Syntrophosphaera sp.]|nr:ABC transporter permease subunit [Candidatus Syntrophosphaera sp.]
MNFKKAGIVYRKEILEMLRDRRTLFATIVLPVIMYPLLFMGFTTIMSRQTEVLEKRGATIAFQDSLQIRDTASLAMSSAIQNSIDGIEFYSLMPSPPEVERLHKEKEIQAIVTLSDSVGASGLPTYKVRVRYDASDERGQLVYRRIDQALMQTAQEEIGNRLSSLRVDPQLIKPIIIDPVDTSTAEKKMGSILGIILPYMMILMLVAGASTIAADLVAGEKERRTLETLLVSSATRSEIVLGKYLTIITMAMINVVINLVSISLSIRFFLSQSGLATQSIQMPISAFGILLLAMLPLATLFAALLLSISTFSRNMKEARTYEQPILMVSMLLGMISFIPSVEINNLLALIPVVNIALLFKAVMINEYNLTHFLITVGSTLVLDVFAIWLTVRLFNTESVLFRTEDDSSIKNVARNKRSFFNSFYGLLYFALAVIALYYIGGSLQAKDMIKGLTQTQVFIILLPVLLLLRALKLKPREILRLKLPRLKEVLLIPFIAVSAALIVAILSQFINSIYPFPEEYIEALSRLFTQDVPLWQMFLVIAVLPGICEEILFRGFMVRFYEGKSLRLAVIASALLFAVFHLDPFRFVPVFLLGLLLGYLTLRSGSIINSMLSHTINNGLALFIVTYASQPWLQPFIQDADNLHYWVLAPALLVFAGSMALFHKATAPQEVS